MSEIFFKKIIFIIVFSVLISLSCAKEVIIEETDESLDNDHYKTTDKFNDIIGKLTNKNLERLMNFGGVLKTRLYDINGMLIYQDDEHLSKFQITEITPKNYQDKKFRKNSDTFNVIMKDLSPFELESSEEHLSNEIEEKFISKKTEIKINNMKNNTCNSMNCNSNDDKFSTNNNDHFNKQIDDDGSRKNLDSEAEEILDDSGLEQEEINKPTDCKKCGCIDNCYNGCNDKLKKNKCLGNKCKILNTDARKNINHDDISKEKKIDDDKTSKVDESTQKDLVKKTIKYYKMKGVNASIEYDDDNDTKVQSSSTPLNDKNVGKRRFTMSLNSLLTLLAADADKKNTRKNIQNNELSIEKKTKVKLNSSELSGRGNSHEDIDLTRKNKKFKEPQVSSRHITKDQKVNENVAGVILPQFNITENGQDQHIKIHDKNSSFNEDKIEFFRRSNAKLYTVSSNNNSVELKILNDSNYEDYKNNFHDDLNIDNTKPANRMFGFDTPIIGIKTDLSPKKIQSGKILSLKNNLAGKTSTESSNLNNKETATESLDKKILMLNKNSEIDNIEEHENEDMNPKNRLFGLSTLFDEELPQRVTYKKRRTSNDMKTSPLPLKLNSKEITTENLNKKISKMKINKSNNLSTPEKLKLESAITTTASSITEPMKTTKNPDNNTSPVDSSTNNNYTTELNNAETTTIINSLNSTIKIENSTVVQL